jgi:hypothetical protein
VTEPLTKAIIDALRKASEPEPAPEG